MKKTFYQINARSIFPFVSLLFLIALGVYAIVVSLCGESPERFWVGLIPIGVAVYSAITYLYYRVEFLDDKLITLGDINGTIGQTQYKVEIKYSEIEDVRLVFSNKNSKKKSYNIATSNIAPKMYFEFLLKSGKTKWICINQFSKKQRIEMLEIINSKTGKNFDYNLLEEHDLSIYNFKKKK